MLERKPLFYMANFEPEAARMAKAFSEGNKESVVIFQKKIINLINNILATNEVSTAGREEWLVMRNLTEGFENLDNYSKKVFLSYGQPFSNKFAMML